MTDDWKLKIYHADSIEDEGKGWDCSEHQAIYYKKDIETLRNKLIEDIIDFHDNITLLSARDKHILIEQINKRFGVE